MSQERLTLVFSPDAADPVAVLRLILAGLSKGGIDAQVRLDDKPVTPADVVPRFQRRGRRPFELDAGDLSFSFATVRNSHLEFLSIKGEPRGVRGWDGWVSKFIDDPWFVEGRLVDVEYNYWQNAADLLEYEANGKLHSHLPKKSNGLPPPLARLSAAIRGDEGETYDFLTGEAADD